MQPPHFQLHMLAHEVVKLEIQFPEKLADFKEWLHAHTSDSDHDEDSSDDGDGYPSTRALSEFWRSSEGMRYVTHTKKQGLTDMQADLYICPICLQYKREHFGVARLRGGGVAAGRCDTIKAIERGKGASPTDFLVAVAEAAEECDPLAVLTADLSCTDAARGMGSSKRLMQKHLEHVHGISAADVRSEAASQMLAQCMLRASDGLVQKFMAGKTHATPR